MPVSYHISPVIACIIVRLEGSVSDDALLERQQQMFSDPLFRGSYSRLVDATEVTEFAVSARLSGLWPAPPLNEACVTPRSSQMTRIWLMG